ncbi:hypothetical protein KJA14_00250 [Patescibacteria group bacterium]|nr:hypothetical protein [Patescibacteria group bacterium]
MNSKFKIQNSKLNVGVTLVELVVIIGILVILALISAPVFRFFQKESDLNNNTEEIINTLRFAQNRTLASEGASQYGVYFDNTTSPHQYTLFKGTDFASRDSSSDEIHKLAKAVEFYEINLNGGNELVFDRVTGKTSQPGNVSLRLKVDLTKTKTIYIESSGQVGLTIPSVPTDGQVEDSRHVHSDLGWSIQNSTALKFSFPDIPQVETIDMADYFNTGKTEFDWEGTFSVGGIDQIFRVHTHALDAFNTLLCIHRNRNDGKNNQEVIIYIVDGGIDKDIAHYLADAVDTVEKGFYVNTMERQ